MAALIGEIGIYLLFFTLVIFSVGLFIKEDLVINYRKVVSSISLLLVVLVILSLYKLIFNNEFQYHYVWHHSALDMPVYYKLSCLWEGQEGSFLLWVFWNALFLVFLSFSSERVFIRGVKFLVLIQAFLVSMLLGFAIGEDIEIGSSPFVLLKDRIQSGVYAVNPQFIPSDGKGMNALLRNYWMVIHPPIIFLGFSISSIPFVLCLGSLYNREIEKWVDFAFPWVLAAVLFVGMGMVMGAFWAYETLNFGGFWNWDPVENAVYIPWLFLIATLHLMILFKKRKKGLKALINLTLCSFLLIVYSTFLTRSGILGESSVHAFTDLGLSSQLLLFLIFFILISLIIYQRVSSHFVSSKEKISFGFEFWLSIGVLVLCLSAFQVFLPTSFPVINTIASSFGFNLRLAPPVNPVDYYTSFQLWFAVVLLSVLIIAQFKYWRVNSSKSTVGVYFKVCMIAIVVYAFFVFWFGVDVFFHHVILFVTIVVFAGNVYILLSHLRLNRKSGGALSHIGFTVLIWGIVISQGYQKIITESSELKGKLNSKGNVFLQLDEKITLGDLRLKYRNSFYRTDDGKRINKKDVQRTFRSNEVEVLNSFSAVGATYQKGELIEVNTRNSFYSVLVQEGDQETEIIPRVQRNAKMGAIASPSIKRDWFKDVYTHVSNFPNPAFENKWQLKQVKEGIELGQVFKIDNDSRSLCFREIEDRNINKTQLELEVKSNNSDIILLPNRFQEVGKDKKSLEMLLDADTKISLSKSNSKNTSYQIKVLVKPKDWITIKAIEFPLMSMIWLGSILLLSGVVLSLYMSLKEGIFSQNIVVDSKVKESLVHLIDN